MAPSSTNKGDYSAPSASSSSSARRSSKRQDSSAPPVDPGYGDSLSDEEGGYAGGSAGGDTGGAAPLVKASKKDKADKSRGDYAPIGDPSSASTSGRKSSKKHKKDRTAVASGGGMPYSDEEANVGYDYGTPEQPGGDDGSGGDDGGKSKKKWWWIGGGVVLILIIIIGAAVYLINKNKDSTSTEEADSTAASALDDEHSSNAFGSASGHKSASSGASSASATASSGLAELDEHSSSAKITSAPVSTGTGLSDLDDLETVSGDKSGASSPSSGKNALSTSTGLSYTTLDSHETATAKATGTTDETETDNLLTLGAGETGSAATSTKTAGPSGVGASSVAHAIGASSAVGGDEGQAHASGLNSSGGDEIYINPLRPTSASGSSPSGLVNLDSTAGAHPTSASIGQSAGGNSYGGDNDNGAASPSATGMFGASPSSLSGGIGLAQSQATGVVQDPTVDNGQNDTDSPTLEDGNDKFLTLTPLPGYPSLGLSPASASGTEEPMFSIQTVPNPEPTGNGGFDYAPSGGVDGSSFAPSSTSSAGGPQKTQTVDSGNAGSMGKVFNTTAIFYSEINWTGACGEEIQADSPTIALPRSLWPDVVEASSLCGEEVMVRNPTTGQKVIVHVADASNRSSYSILPAAIFQQLGGALANGELEVQFRFVDGTLEIEETEVEPDKGKYKGKVEMGEVHEGTAVYYSEVDWTGACGEQIKADSLVFSLPLSLYGDPSTASTLCGAEAILRNPDSGSKVTVHVASPSEDERLELPAAVYQSLGGDLNAGELKVEWRFVDGSVEQGGSSTEGEQSEGGEWEAGEGEEEQGQEQEEEGEQTWGGEAEDGTTPRPEPTEVPDGSATQASQPLPNPTKNTDGAAEKTEPLPNPTEDTDGATEWAAEPKQNAASNGNNGSGKVYSGGSATYYEQKGRKGACGTASSDSSLIVALPSPMYAGGKYCGKKVKITRMKDGGEGKKGREVEAVVMDECPTCENANSLDLSVGAFRALGGTQDEGMFNIKWEFVNA